jgi:PhzF family phenazine biosynthesis protein
MVLYNCIIHSENYTMKQLTLYQIDAFATSVFTGNPAGVCALDTWLTDKQMQDIAEENNLSETAFIVPENDYYRIRWFTPNTEVDLCDHGTLASAFVLFNQLKHSGSTILFQSNSGELRVSKQNNQLQMDFPALPYQKITPTDEVFNALSINGIILLLDATTDEPKALMVASYLTALRTGAVTGLATRILAGEDASHVAIIGSGVLALTQLEAVAHVRPIHLKDIKKDAHINAIGSHPRTMHEIAPEIFKHATTVVDQHEAAIAEAGKIIAAIEAGLLDAASVLELGSLLKTKESKLKQQLTVFKSVGLAIQDIGVAEKVYENAEKCQLGQRFDLS